MTTFEQNSRSQYISALGITDLNAMQQAAINAITENQEVLLLSPTGSGKTIAFLLPIVEKLNRDVTEVQCMIVVPTRELALQIEQVWRKMSTGFKVTCCYGGHDMQTEIRSLTEAPALLIGTPGRILDHLHRTTFSTRSILTLVLDEFDKSLEMGFQEEMNEIVRQLRNAKSKILVSATAKTKVPGFMKFKNPIELDFISEGNQDEGLTIRQVLCEPNRKMEGLVKLLSFLGAESTMIFCNQRDTVEFISQNLANNGMDSVYFHGKLEQADRERALIRFRNKSVLYLVATDLAARGLDIPEMKHVIHFETPMKADEFVHRNGRTARMLSKGTAYVMIEKDQNLPEYIYPTPKSLDLPNKIVKAKPAAWTTVYISGGKKNKLTKMDIVGFIIQKGKLNKEDLGLIEVKDTVSFVAINSEKLEAMLENIKEEKMKGKKFKIEVAK